MGSEYPKNIVWDIWTFEFRIYLGFGARDLEFDLFEGGDSLVRFHSPDPGFLLHLVRVRSG